MNRFFKSYQAYFIYAFFTLLFLTTTSQSVSAAPSWTNEDFSNLNRISSIRNPLLNPRMTTESSTIYVDVKNTTGLENGSQAYPFNTIQEGLGVALAGGTVQVAPGVYYERITLKSGVVLLGAGAEATVIDGTNQDDSVITASYTGSGTILDGFTITHGTGKWTGSYTYGGGAYISNSTLVIRNCLFITNHSSDGAGGLQSYGSKIDIQNSRFMDNHGWWGGAMTLAGGSEVEIRDSLIDQSSGGYGGGILIAESSAVTLTNNVVMHTGYIPAIGIDDGAGRGGSSTVSIINNTIVENGGAGIAWNKYGEGGSVIVKNTILWGNNDDLINVNATYSDIEDGDPGEGNISTYPMFVDSGHQDYHLLGNSQCLDAGTNDEAPLVDFEGDPRPADSNGDGIKTVDIGADELYPLVANKQALSNAAPGGHLAYNISLANTSEINMSSVILTDTLPVQVNYLAGSLTALKGDFGYANGVITWTVNLAPSESAIITYQTIVDKNIPIGTRVSNSAAIQIASDRITRTATVNVGNHKVYLPVTTKPRPGIHGRVYLNGTPAQAIPIDLRYFDGSTWTTRDTTSTDSDGYYTFINEPGLQNGQLYYVRYLNSTGTSGRLWVWGTRELTMYGAGSAINLGDFDIANIELVTPAYGATITLPYTFQWIPRSATPSDTYEFDLYDPSDYDPNFYTDPLLGYVGNFTLNTLPAGFNPGVSYVWEIWIYSPDGGYGISYESRSIIFSNRGLTPIFPTLPLFEKKNWQPKQDTTIR